MSEEERKDIIDTYDDEANRFDLVQNFRISGLCSELTKHVVSWLLLCYFWHLMVGGEGKREREEGARGW